MFYKPKNLVKLSSNGWKNAVRHEYFWKFPLGVHPLYAPRTASLYSCFLTWGRPCVHSQLYTNQIFYTSSDKWQLMTLQCSHSSLQDSEGSAGISLLQLLLLRFHSLHLPPLSYSLSPLLSSGWSKFVVWTVTPRTPKTATLLLLLQLPHPSRPLLRAPSGPRRCCLRAFWVSLGSGFVSCLTGGSGVWPELRSAGSAPLSGSRARGVPRRRAPWLRTARPGNATGGSEGGMPEDR